jgi:hypothetical protein
MRSRDPSIPATRTSSFAELISGERALAARCKVFAPRNTRNNVNVPKALDRDRRKVPSLRLAIRVVVSMSFHSRQFACFVGFKSMIPKGKSALIR